jgi:hypothetical protein
VLRIFISLKNPSPRPGLYPWPLGLVSSILTKFKWHLSDTDTVMILSLRKAVKFPPYPPQIRHGLTWAKTRASRQEATNRLSYATAYPRNLLYVSKELRILLPYISLFQDPITSDTRVAPTSQVRTSVMVLLPLAGSKNVQTCICFAALYRDQWSKCKYINAGILRESETKTYRQKNGKR